MSETLGRDLVECGEKVDFDFAGLCVWARTTTGQAIAMDSCIAATLTLIDKRVADLNTGAEG